MLSLLTPLLLAVSVFANPVKRDLGPVVVFDPPANFTNQRTLYGRSLILAGSNHILTTWENYSPPADGLVYFPIFKSEDHGATWKNFSGVHDQVNGWGLRYQPFLYQLPEDFAGFKKGTVLLAGNSIPEDLSKTQLDLYASKDEGLTWSFVSHIASGGEAEPINGLTPIWEPFLLLWKNQLICYYSDQRDPSFGQKLVHQITTDAHNWGEVVNDVTYPNATFRPGMAILSELPTGDWFYTYEFFGAPEIAFAAYYKIAHDPLSFGSVVGQAVVATDHFVPSSSPYNTWTPKGGRNGTLIMNAASSNDLFINTNLGLGPWTRLSSPSPASYTRSLRVTPWDESQILIVGGGPITGDGSTNEVTDTVQTVVF